MNQPLCKNCGGLVARFKRKDGLVIRVWRMATAQYCSNACRQAAYRKRKKQEALRSTAIKRNETNKGES